MAKTKHYILGLDIGVNSVGWAVVDCDIEKIATKGGEQESERYFPTGLRDLNARIFQEMMEAKTGVPKNQKRRTMRGMRRRTSRLKGRRNALIAYLQKRKMLPQELDEAFFNQVAHRFATRVSKLKAVRAMGFPARCLLNPMFMRAYGLDNELEAEEFSCALLQLQKRRGYKSNRGAKYDDLLEYVHQEMGTEYQEDDSKEDDSKDDKDKKDKEEEEETRKVLGGITELKNEMAAHKSRTIAEYVLQRAQEEKGPLMRITKYVVKKDSDVSLYAERKLYKEEFAAPMESASKASQVARQRQKRNARYYFPSKTSPQSAAGKKEMEASQIQRYRRLLFQT